MTVKKPCERCRVRPAAVPDRNRPGQPIKRICVECHAKELGGDLRRVVQVEAEKRNEPQ